MFSLKMDASRACRYHTKVISSARPAGAKNPEYICCIPVKGTGTTSEGSCSPNVLLRVLKKLTGFQGFFFRVSQIVSSTGTQSQFFVSVLRENHASSQTIGLACRVTTRHCAGYIRIIPRVIPRPWLVAETPPCITNALFVQSIEPARRHSRDQHEIASDFNVVEGFLVPDVD